MKTIRSIIFCLGVATICTACSTAPYDKRSSTTDRVVDSAARYGSIAAATTAGAVGAYSLNQSPVEAAAGGIAAGGLMYAFNKFGDGQKQSAYDSGIADGANAVRAQVLNDVWLRDAVFGNGKTGGEAKQLTQKRRVYVPTRTVNGVVMQGAYQEVDFYP